MAFSKREVENTLRTIFKRCVECPPGTPACPTCEDPMICSLIPEDCSTCAHATCIRNPQPPPSHGPNVGAIAGGVIGGIVFVGIFVFFVWRFWIKKKRERQDRELQEEWAEEDDIAHQKSLHMRSMMGDAASTRTRGSLANSILSRASNIIQIAYIPGVTNRNNSSILESNPVPPIPATLRDSQTPKSPLSNEGDALFFRPGDLRDSTWSATSTLRSGQAGNRDTQYTMKSITPSLARSSVASELYQSDVPAMPATTVARAAPRMVSVKSSNSTETMNSSKSPATSSQTSRKSKGPQILMPISGGVPSKQSSMRAKAKQVTVGAKGRFPISRTASEASANHAPNRPSPLAQRDEPSDDESGGEEHARARQSLLRNQSTAGSDLQDFATPAAQPAESPFFDESEAAPATSASIAAAARPNSYASAGSTSTETSTQKRGGKGNGGLSAVLEEATKRASRQVSHEGLGGKEKDEQDTDPFSDSHSTK